MTTQLLGADPLSHDALRTRLDSPGDRAPGPSWQDRLLAGVQMREVETESAAGTFTKMRGLAVPYGAWASIGWFLEQFDRGSLTKSIDEATAAGRDLPLNLFHDNHSWPIGAADDWEETRAGLIGTWRIDDTERAQEAARMADQRLLTGLSIEFSPIRSEWEWAEDWNPALGPEHMDRVTRTEARLGAVGLVQTPAYVAAGVEHVRSADRRRRGLDAAGDAAPPSRTNAPGLAEWKAELARMREA
jgi:HK97 family phage prohead protease